MIFSPAGKALWDALAKESEWEVEQYTITHKPSSTVWWTGNGGLFFNGYRHTPACLGLLERHIIWRRAATLASRSVAQRLAYQDRKL